MVQRTVTSHQKSIDLNLETVASILVMGNCCGMHLFMRWQSKTHMNTQPDVSVTHTCSDSISSPHNCPDDAALPHNAGEAHIWNTQDYQPASAEICITYNVRDQQWQPNNLKDNSDIARSQFLKDSDKNLEKSILVERSLEEPEVSHCLGCVWDSVDKRNIRQTACNISSEPMWQEIDMEESFDTYLNVSRLEAGDFRQGVRDFACNMDESFLNDHALSVPIEVENNVKSWHRGLDDLERRSDKYFNTVQNYNDTLSLEEGPGTSFLFGNHYFNSTENSREGVTDYVSGTEPKCQDESSWKVPLTYFLKVGTQVGLNVPPLSHLLLLTKAFLIHEKI